MKKRIRYYYGRAIAVKRVISNKGKNTPGIDGSVWSTDKAKEDAIINLETKISQHHHCEESI